MNKTDLINQLAERLDGDKKAAQAAVEGFIDLVQREVQKGRNVSISGFGVFEKRARAARTARNPRTGEAVKVKKTTVPAFRPGKYFKDVIAGSVKLPKPTGKPTSARAAAAADGREGDDHPGRARGSSRSEGRRDHPYPCRCQTRCSSGSPDPDPGRREDRGCRTGKGDHCQGAPGDRCQGRPGRQGRTEGRRGQAGHSSDSGGQGEVAATAPGFKVRWVVLASDPPDLLLFLPLRGPRCHGAAP